MKGNAVSQVYARVNFKISENLGPETISEWQKLLHGTALWGGADDVEVFVSEKANVIGVSIPVEPDAMLILEAGHVFGFVAAAVEKSNLRYTHKWMSFNDENGNVIESPV
jgi:hypothetical protein